jgi:hypothetical protein
MNKPLEKTSNKLVVIPYIDQKIGFWEKLSEEYGKNIKEVYYPVTEVKIGTGRPKQPDKHLTSFLKSGIFPLSILINPLVLPRPTEEVATNILKILEFHIKHYHLSGVTTSSVSLAQIIKNTFPNLKLTASTLMEIYSNQQLVMLGDFFDTLVPSNRILRDIKALQIIKNHFKGKIRLMVNEACLSACVYRTQHFYEMSNPEITYPRSLCNKLLEQKPWLRITGGWVLPQHLYLFDDLYDEIKLSGRVSLQKPEKYIRVLDSYIHKKDLFPHEIGGGPASVGLPIKIKTEFYQYTLSCAKNCSECTICQEYWTENAGKHE